MTLESFATHADHRDLAVRDELRGQQGGAYASDVSGGFD